jgi:hypothetical protein
MKPSFDISKQPLDQLNLSKNFQITCEEMGFDKIEDIILVPSKILVHRKGFTFHWLSELISFLQQNGALHLLQEKPVPGNTCA